MPIPRDYYRPGDPEARAVWHVSHEKERTYHEDVKTVCRKGASSRLPKAPDVCPRCGRSTGFLGQLCYMQGVAGAYALIGRTCGHRHWPIQKGPSEAQLEEIEAARERTKKDNISPSKPHTRPHHALTIVRARTSQKVQVTKASRIGLSTGGKNSRNSKRPAGVSIIRTKTRLGGEKQPGDGPFGQECGRGPQDEYKGAAREQTDDHSEDEHSDDCAGPYKVTVVLWYATGESAEKRMWEVGGYCNEHMITLSHMWWVYSRGDKFDYWSYDLAQWLKLDRITEGIPVEKECCMLFVRVRDTRCLGFPAELCYAEESTGWLKSPHTLAETLARPIHGRTTVILWTEDHSAPEIFSLPLLRDDILVIERTEAFQRGLTGLEGARNIAYWDEDLGQWEGMALSAPLRVDPTAPIILLRRQDAFYIHGLGDALQFLTRHRACQRKDAGEVPRDGTRLATSDEVTSAEREVAQERYVGSGQQGWVACARARSPSLEIVDDAEEIAAILAKASARRRG
ncbi:hypothetical protein C8Q76DRAFT_801432 [Earliella scabrosa]|nr:hypothetical protein C8Q76DRAFT_801432 [Earliella scabrosa]